jgi:aspartyl-tRNA(Asn)/glutamyl-tRNA(Gln) amidotransferase subunit A
MKPTFGAIDPAGVVPLAWSMDTVGFLARTVADCALLFASTADALEGASPGERRMLVARVARGAGGGPVRLGVARNVVDLAEPDIRGGFGAVAERLASAATVEDVDLPRVDDAMLATLIILLAEGGAAWESGLRDCWAAYGPPVRGLLDLGRLVRAADYIQALRAREGIRRAVAGLFERYDALIMPCMGISPRPGVFDGDTGAVGPDSLMWRLEARFTCMWNLTGCPVVSIPCAFTPSGYPFAMQVVTPPGADERALRLAALAEAVLAIPREDLVPTWVRGRLAAAAPVDRP